MMFLKSANLLGALSSPGAGRPKNYKYLRGNKAARGITSAMPMELRDRRRIRRPVLPGMLRDRETLRERERERKREREQACAQVCVRARVFTSLRLRVQCDCTRAPSRVRECTHMFPRGCLSHSHTHTHIFPRPPPCPSISPTCACVPPTSEPWAHGTAGAGGRPPPA